MITLFLTRRNLMTLLAKLDRVADGGESERTLIKRDNNHKTYPITGADSVMITAVEDADYYTDRKPGPTLEDV